MNTNNNLAPYERLGFYGKSEGANNILESYRGDSSTVNIPKVYSRVKKSAFERNEHIENLVIPEEITEIGERAFLCCKNLKSVEFCNSKDNSALKIGALAFLGCEKLETVDFGNRELTLADEAFKECRSLRKAILPKQTKEIGRDCFFHCTGLEKVDFQNCATSIGESAFMDCKKLTTVNLGQEILNIEASAFRNCASLEHIEIPKANIDECLSSRENKSTLKGRTLKQHSFSFCTELGSLTLHRTTKEIDESAFQDCTKLTKIVIKSEESENITCDIVDGDFINNDRLREAGVVFV